MSTLYVNLTSKITVRFRKSSNPEIFSLKSRFIEMTRLKNYINCNLSENDWHPGEKIPKNR